MAAANLPNFIVVMCDQQRREHLGCYGSPYGATPNLDRLARESTIFDKAYTAYPVCTPARGSIFTGRTPHMCGAYSNDMPLYETIPTMGEIFRKHGYTTGYIGKWHLDGGGYMGSGEAARGFPEAYWYDGAKYLADIGPENKELGYGNCTNEGLRERDVPDHLCWATRSTDRAVSFLHENAGASGNPFLLVVSYDEPHPPAICPARFMDQVDVESVAPPATIADELGGKPDLHHRWQQADIDQYNVNAEDMREGIHRYLACNAYVDNEIGRLLDTVSEIDEGNTVVIYTADHGDFCGDFGLTGKGAAMYEAITGVPLLIHTPEGMPGEPGSRTDSLASTMDLIPTMLDLAGLKEDTAFDGISLLPTLANPRQNSRDEVMIRFDRYGIRQKAYGGFFPIRCIRTDRWKFSINVFDKDELYDMETDPREGCNLIDSTEYADIRDKLHDRLIEELERQQDPVRGEAINRRVWREHPPGEFRIA